MSRNPRYPGPGHSGSTPGPWRNDESNGNAGYADQPAWNNRVVVDSSCAHQMQHRQAAYVQAEAYQPNMALNPMMYQQMNQQQPGSSNVDIGEFPWWLDTLDQGVFQQDQAQFMGTDPYVATSTPMPNQGPPQQYGAVPAYSGPAYPNQQQQQQQQMQAHFGTQQPRYCAHHQALQRVPAATPLGHQHGQVQQPQTHLQQAVHPPQPVNQSPYSIDQYAMQHSQQAYATVSPQPNPHQFTEEVPVEQPPQEESPYVPQELNDETAITFAHEALMRQDRSAAKKDKERKKRIAEIAARDQHVNAFKSYTEAGGVDSEAQVRENLRKLRLNTRCPTPPGQDDMVHVVPSTSNTKVKKIIEESQKIKNQMMEEEPEHWAQIQYCEFEERFEPRLLTSEESVIVDGLTGQTRPGRFCMGAISYGSRKPGVQSVRTQIGKGLELTYKNGEVWVRNLMSQRPLFVESTLRNLMRGDPQGTIYRVHSLDSLSYGELGCIKVFDENFFQTRLEKLMAHPDPDLQRKETNMSQPLLQSYSIRISFIKGYGSDYPRTCVWECPTWIEIIFPKAHHKIFKAITSINYVEDFLQPKEPNNISPQPSMSNPWFN